MENGDESFADLVGQFVTSVSNCMSCAGRFDSDKVDEILSKIHSQRPQKCLVFAKQAVRMFCQRGCRKEERVALDLIVEKSKKYLSETDKRELERFLEQECG